MNVTLSKIKKTSHLRGFFIFDIKAFYFYDRAKVQTSPMQTS